jgi:hypothetical protein
MACAWSRPRPACRSTTSAPRPGRRSSPREPTRVQSSRPGAARRPIYVASVRRTPPAVPSAAWQVMVTSSTDVSVAGLSATVAPAVVRVTLGAVGPSVVAGSARAP